MIQDHLDKIEARVQGASNIPEETKTELLGLIAELKTEAGGLPAAEDGQAPVDADNAVEKLTGSVSEFETSHPKLAQLINRLAVTLSGVGI